MSMTPEEYARMDEKLKPVTELLINKQPQMALDKLRYMMRQNIFLPNEQWRAVQRLGDCYFEMSDIETASKIYWELLTQYTDGIHLQKEQQIFSNYLFISHYLPELSDNELRDRHFLFEQLTRATVPFEHNRKKLNPKIRIGYIAPLQSYNVLSFFTTQLYTLYDKEHFQVYLYALFPTHDAQVDTLAKHVDAFTLFEKNTSPMIIARKIYEDEVDILFDVGMHSTGGKSVQVLSYRPAPVQMGGIGYMSTSGIHAYDYFLTDEIVDPLGQNDSDFTEKLVRLPHTHFCYTPPARIKEAKKTYHMHSPIVFGCFNNFAKFNKITLEMWLKILQRVPHSQLLLKGGTPLQQKYLRKHMQKLGFPMERCQLEDKSHDYFDRYMDIDIALDPYPYVGGSTTCDALLRGVPVISRYGQRHGSRFGLSLLKNIEHEELTAPTEEKYIEKAVALANDTPRLQYLHDTLANAFYRSPIMNGKNYVHEVEQAYMQIWQHYALANARV